MRRLSPLLCGLLLLGGCKVDLYTSLSEYEANQMVAVLAAEGIAADKILAADGTHAVQIEKQQFAQAVNALNATGYPKKRFATLGDVFAEGGLVSTPTEERARLVYALSQELSSTISEIDGVRSARVHVVLPNNDPLGRDLVPSSASVAIHHDSDRSVEALIPQIKVLVANSIEGLIYDNVTVVLFPAELPSPAPTTLAAQHALPAEPSAAASIALPKSTTGQVILGLLIAGVVAGAAAGWEFWRRWKPSS